MIRLAQKNTEIAEFVDRPIIKSSQSSQHTPTGTARWHLMSNNNIILNRVGVWLVKGWITFGRTGGEPYDGALARWADVNGDDTGSTPAGVPNAIININSINSEVNEISSGWGATTTRMNDIYIDAPIGNQTVYLTLRTEDNAGLFASQRISTQIIAEFIDKANINSVDFGI